jgi:mycothiol system anti-sigma-R factor
MTQTNDREPECQQALREIEGLIDGELDPAIRGVVVEHLYGCEDCMSHAEFRQALKALVRDSCTERVAPEGLEQRIRALLHEPGA